MLFSTLRSEIAKWRHYGSEVLDGFYPGEDQMVELSDMKYSFQLKQKPHLLLVDDDSDQADYYSTLLERSGYKTWTANSAAAAFDILGRESIDCIVCDVFMPGMSGLTFVERLRTLDEFEHIPIIMFTSGRLDLELEALSVGADMFCPKLEAKDRLVEQIQLLFA